jgi:hypothetical protein
MSTASFLVTCSSQSSNAAMPPPLGRVGTRRRAITRAGAPAPPRIAPAPPVSYRSDGARRSRRAHPRSPAPRVARPSPPCGRASRAPPSRAQRWRVWRSGIDGYTHNVANSVVGAEQGAALQGAPDGARPRGRARARPPSPRWRGAWPSPPDGIRRQSGVWSTCPMLVSTPQLRSLPSRVSPTHAVANAGGRPPCRRRCTHRNRSSRPPSAQSS